MSERESGLFASPSIGRHLLRGAVGFGLIGSALGLATTLGTASLLLLPLGLVALRGCPMCWTVGLLETISGSRIQASCELQSGRPRMRSTQPGPSTYPDRPRAEG